MSFDKRVFDEFFSKKIFHSFLMGYMHNYYPQHKQNTKKLNKI
jgi:hypothetical protein